MTKCLLALLSAFALLTPVVASGAVLFSEDFESGGTSLYGFEGEYNGRCTTYPNWNNCPSSYWAVQHMPSGGWAGSDGARLIYRQGYDQGSMGWYGGTGNLKNWQQGDYFFVRFRIRFDSTMRWDGSGSQQNKMFIWGHGTYGGMNHRIMLHQEKDHGTSPCAELPPTYSNSEFGLFSVKRNIQDYCTPPIPVTHGTWYHVQFYAKSSTTADSTDAEFKLWVNNNALGSPSSQKIGGFNLAVSGIWDQGFSFGGFWTDQNDNRDVSWVIDDFQIADTFDASWSSASTSTPSPPVNLRVE